MALPFMKAETEENATQSMAFIAIIAMTIGLAIFNVCGAIASSESGNWLEMVIRIAFALVITGAEFLAAVALVRVMLAKNWGRAVVGTLIFLGLAWVCIQNGKRAAHLIFPEFKASAFLLEKQAELAGQQADREANAQQAATDAIPALLAKVQQDIAKFEREQRLMQAQSPERIAEMQQMLITNGYYYYQVDGRIGPETERAMRSYGEIVRNELESLRSQERNLIAGATSVTPAALNAPSQSPNTQGQITLDAATQQAVFEDDARRARNAAIWIEVMLWVAEGARSFGLWALVITIDSKSEERRRNSERAKKGHKTRKEKADAEKEPELVILPQVEDKGWWDTQIEKALGTGILPHARTAEGMARVYFHMMPGELDARLMKMVRDGYVYDKKKGTKLIEDDVDFILCRGVHEYKKKDESTEGEKESESETKGNETEQEVNGVDQNPESETQDDTTDDTDSGSIFAIA